MTTDLTICIVNYNSSAFIALTLEALARLTDAPYQVIIRDNNSRKRDYAALRRIAAGYGNVAVYRSDTPLVGSVAHGTALNELVQRIDTPYGVILDADATFLQRGWDTILRSRLSETAPIYGTQADTGGGKPEDFPLMFAVLFKTDILKGLHIDFRPADLRAFQDTGWELREKYRAAGYGGGLLYSFSTRVFRTGPFKDVACTEYYLDPAGTGKIFASHFGRGSAPSAKKLVYLRTGIGIVDKIVARALWYSNLVKWRQDRRRWIETCRQLIRLQ